MKLFIVRNTLGHMENGRRLMQHLVVSLAAIIVMATGSAKAQSLTDITSSIRGGGGWVAIAIENGEGSYSSVRLPTLNLKLNGCVTVWDKLSGTWEIEATETVTNTRLLLSADPGIGVPFSHQFGIQGQVDVSIRWSEPSNTILLLWVGLTMEADNVSKACEPQTEPPIG